ncbi:MAG: hypothetical protein GEU26_09425 [Nitrososphaeraceae archaeon]|nr:hypothetical protein [Nitrososphaeraceae archaeon]
MTAITTTLTPEQREAILQWPERNDIPIFPADTRNKKIWLSSWQDIDFSKIDFRSKLENGEYDKGIAIRMGKTLSGKYYAVAFDFDGRDAVVEWFGNWDRVVSLSKKTIIEWHQDKGKIHVIFLSKIPFQNRKLHIKNAFLEIRCERNALFASPSIHQGGKPYTPLGTNQLTILNGDKALALKSKIDSISQSYMSDEDKKAYDEWLDLPTTILGENQGRHDATKFKIIRYYWKYDGEWLNLSDEQRFERAWEWHLAHCNPPRSRHEFDSMCKWAIEKFRVKRDELHERVRAERQDNGQKAADKENEQSQDRRNELLDLINERTRELLVDKHDTAFAAVQIGEHFETLPIKSGRFKKWICRLNYQHLHKTIRAEDLKQITDLLQAEALFGNNVRDLELRTSKNPEDRSICYDLTNKEWQVVRITQQGWSVEESCDMPIMFTRYANQLPQITPSTDYPEDIFERFMNLINVKDDSNKLLLRCYIVSLFLPGVPKPILMLHGEQGSAKSTLQELVKRLVDPSIIISLTFPRSNEELIQQMSHNYVAYYDNISFIKEWISDQLCRAVTGAGFSKRELYSDDDDIIYNFKRCLGFNGINLAATKADLLDRGIIIELERIPKENRRKIEEILEEFEPMMAQLLGYIFDILVKVLQVKNSGGIKLETRSRMADFEEYAEIISRCMGTESGKFIEAYYKNQQLQTEVVIEGSPVAMAIVKLMEGKEEYGWTGTTTELLTDLELVTAELKINTQSNSWPKAANVLSRRLNEIKTSLRDADISIDYIQDPGTRVKKIKICKVSFESFNRSEDQNHA